MCLVKSLVYCRIHSLVLTAPGSNQVVCKFYLQQWVTLGVRVNYVGKEAGHGSLNNFLISNSLAFIHA